MRQYPEILDSITRDLYDFSVLLRGWSKIESFRSDTGEEQEYTFRFYDGAYYRFKSFAILYNEFMSYYNKIFPSDLNVARLNRVNYGAFKVNTSATSGMGVVFEEGAINAYSQLDGHKNVLSATSGIKTNASMGTVSLTSDNFEVINNFGSPGIRVTPTGLGPREDQSQGYYLSGAGTQGDGWQIGKVNNTQRGFWVQSRDKTKTVEVNYRGVQVRDNSQTLALFNLVSDGISGRNYALSGDGVIMYATDAIRDQVSQATAMALSYYVSEIEDNISAYINRVTVSENPVETDFADVPVGGYVQAVQLTRDSDYICIRIDPSASNIDLTRDSVLNCSVVIKRCVEVVGRKICSVVLRGQFNVIGTVSGVPGLLILKPYGNNNQSLWRASDIDSTDGLYTTVAAFTVYRPSTYHNWSRG